MPPNTGTTLSPTRSSASKGQRRLGSEGRAASRMTPGRCLGIAACGLVLALGGTPAEAQDAVDQLTLVIDGPPPPQAPEVMSRDAAGRATVRATRLTAPLDIDGTLDEDVYEHVPAISGFIQQEPDEGAAAEHAPGPQSGPHLDGRTHPCGAALVADERAALISLQLNDFEVAQHPLVEALRRCRGPLEPSRDGIAGMARAPGGRRNAHTLDAQARDLVAFPTSAAKAAVRCPRVRADRSPADRAAVPPASAPLRRTRAVAHDVEAQFSTVVTPALGAGHPVDRVHRSRVPGGNPRFSPKISEVKATAQQRPHKHPAATDLPSGQDQRATSISQLAKDIVLSLLWLVAGKAGGFGIRTHHPIAGVTTSESLEAPATRRRITLRVLVHHAQHLACTLGDRVVRAHRLQEVEGNHRAVWEASALIAGDGFGIGVNVVNTAEGLEEGMPLLNHHALDVRPVTVPRRVGHFGLPFNDSDGSSDTDGGEQTC